MNNSTPGTLPIHIGKCSSPNQQLLVHHTLMRGVAYPHAELLHKLIAKADLYVATLESDPDVILGFLLCDSQALCVHYIFVKKDFRKFGIAKKMCAAAFGTTLPKYNSLNISPREAWLFQKYRPRFQPLLLLRFA